MKFLEKHVQWLALGLGAAYLLYMAYAYLGYPYIPGATMPLGVALGKNTKGEENLVVPGEIDETIVKQIIVPLESAMTETKDTKRKLLSIDSDYITISDPAHGDAMSKPQKKYRVIPAPPNAAEWTPNSRWTSITFIGEPKKEISFSALRKDAIITTEDKKEKLKDVLLTVESNAADPTTATKIKLEFPLVELVSETYALQLKEAKTNAAPLATAWFGSRQAAGLEDSGGPIIDHGPSGGPVALPKPPAATPGPNRVQWTVIMVPNGAVDAAGKPVLVRKDVAYFSADFMIDSAALDKAMKDAYEHVPNVVPAMFQPRITRVYLLRQELLSDGTTWGPPKIVDSMPNVQLKAHPDDVKSAAPADAKDKKNAFRDYKIFMEQEQPKILMPAFPPEPADVKATGWTDPGAVAAPAPHPAGAPAVAPAPGPVPVVPKNLAAPIVNKDFQILVHDITLEEGKTYRYAVKYRLYNSVFDGPPLAKSVPPKIEEIFDVQSTPSPVKAEEPTANAADLEKLWSKPVAVEPRSRIFVMHIGQLKSDVELSVFIWKDGRWTEYANKTPVKILPAQSGDLVIANKVPTHWTIVDVRKDSQPVARQTPGNGWYALIMDDQGGITRRDEGTDKLKRDQFMQEKNLVGGGAAAAAVPK